MVQAVDQICGKNNPVIGYIENLEAYFVRASQSMVLLFLKRHRVIES